MLVSKNGQRLPVEGVADSGQIETVYNVTVEEDHTYFVGSEEWGFDVWAHNYNQRKKDIAAGKKLKLSLKHIFKGGRPGGTGDLKGLHHTKGGKPPTGITIVSKAAKGTKGGVYKVRWLGFGKTGKGKKSTLFPDSWSKKKVETAIRQAVGQAQRKGGASYVKQANGKYKFRAKVNGITIEGYVSKSGKTIVTAYPVIPKHLDGRKPYNP